jgi:hypothetical protein
MHQNVELGGKFSGTTILFAGFDDHWGIHELGFFMGGASLQLQTALMPLLEMLLETKQKTKSNMTKSMGTSDLQAQAQTHSPPHYQNSL